MWTHQEIQDSTAKGPQLNLNHNKVKEFAGSEGQEESFTELHHIISTVPQTFTSEHGGLPYYHTAHRVKLTVLKI